MQKAIRDSLFDIRYLMFVICFSLFAGVAQAEQWTMTVTNSTRCIPCVDPVKGGKTVAAWSNAIPVVAGRYYTNTAGTAYMAVTSGTSTNEPTGTGVNSTGDAVTWMNCSGWRWPRGVTACVISGPEVHYNLSAAATTNCPWLVNRTFSAESLASDYFFCPPAGQTCTISFVRQ
jgi:hypothetical protein